MFTDIIGNIANFFYVVGSSFKEQIYIRASFVLAAFCELFYDFYISSEPLWTPIIWTVPMIVINGYYLGKLYHERKTLYLDEKELEVYYRNFSKIDKVVFKRIYKLAERIKVPSGTDLITENESTDSFYLVVLGIMGIYSNNNFITMSNDGTFVGEMSFLTGALPSATVRTETESELLKWNKETVRKAVEKDNEIDSAFKIILSEDLVAKIKRINTKN